MIKSGILAGRRVGRSRLISANTAGTLSEPLTRLIMLTFGPAVVVAEEFAAVAGLEAAYVYGSWAARYDGAEGEPPRDVDVLVIGTPTRGDVYDAGSGPNNAWRGR